MERKHGSSSSANNNNNFSFNKTLAIAAESKKKQKKVPFTEENAASLLDKSLSHSLSFFFFSFHSARFAGRVVVLLSIRKFNRNKNI